MQSNFCEEGRKKDEIHQYHILSGLAIFVDIPQFAGEVKEGSLSRGDVTRYMNLQGRSLIFRLSGWVLCATVLTFA